jgi:hypothetical protein
MMIAESGWGWWGHVNGSGEKEKPTEVLVQNPEENRPLGMCRRGLEKDDKPILISVCKVRRLAACGGGH